MHKKHLNVVCAVISDAGKILCTQRLRKGPGYTAEHWEFPGGKTEPGESDHEALLREIREEMDWDIFVGRKIATIEHEYPDFSITLTAYDCMARDCDFKLLSHIDAKWLTIDELPSLRWTEADRKLLSLLPGTASEQSPAH